MRRIIPLAAICMAATFTTPAFSQTFPLSFNPDNYTIQTLTLDGKTFKVRAYENIIDVAKPIDTTYEKINIYIPTEYFQGKSINGYTATTAPIFYPNKVGGYMPATPATAMPSMHGDFPGGMPPGGPDGPDGGPGGMPPGGGPDGPGGFGGGDGGPGGGPGGGPNGAGFQGGGPGGSHDQGGQNNPGNPDGGGQPRGSTGQGQTNGQGHPGGFGPNQPNAILLALSKGYVVASAGARGRTTRDSDGTYTGKAPADIVDLKAGIRYLKFNDDKMPGNANKIISNGTSAGGAMSALLGATGNNPDYAPYLQAIGAADATDDIFAVSAYCPITNLDHADMAYEWQFNGINTIEKRRGSSKLSSAQVAISEQLKPLFPEYVNSLHLTDKDGKALTLDADGNGSFKDLVKTYVIAAAQKAITEGIDLSKLPWLTTDNGKVIDLDFAAYVKYMQRMKTPPAFDALDLSAGENQLFGTTTVDKQHFTAFSTQHSAITATTADATTVKLMNPMYYIGTPQTKTAQHWRIRHGTKDKDTGLAISVILATYLQDKGIDANLELPWDRPHSGDYDLDELFKWTDSICK